MNFDEAEARFRELQARVQRGEAISRAEYEDQVSQLAVQDDRGVLWEINPRTGKWMYFDGAEWVGGTPPGRDTSTVMPLPRAPAAPPPATPPPAVPRPTPTMASVPPMRTAPASAPMTAPRSVTPRAPVSTGRNIPPPSPENVPPYQRVRASQSRGTPPPPEGPTEEGGVSPLRRLRNPFAGTNREWVPLAIGAVVLLMCAGLLLLVSQVIVPNVAKIAGVTTVTPTRTPTSALPASSPVPTQVRMPTVPLPPPTASVVIGQVTAEPTLNVRAAPNATAKIVVKLKTGDQITLTGKSADGKWYQVNIAGQPQPGYVSADYVQVKSGDANSLPVIGASGTAPTATKAGSAPPVVTNPTPTVIGVKPQTYP